MTSQVDRKIYWDLLETMRWIQTRDGGAVAAIWDWSDDERMAVALYGMKVPLVCPLASGGFGEQSRRRFWAGYVARQRQTRDPSRR